MTMRGIKIAGVLGGMALAASCSPKLSDTGYIGTWTRGKPESLSIISISKSGDRYRFHWKLKSLDGRWTVTCDAQSHCVEVYDGKKIGDYQFATRVDPATGHLIVESTQISYEPTGKVRGTVEDRDELVVEENGLSLGCYTFERNGTRMSRDEGPQRHFQKISNDAMEPGT